MKSAAMMLALMKSLMLNVTPTPRNAMNALKENPIATPLPTAPLPATSLTQNAIQAQANAQSVTQQLTMTAPKPRLHVARNAQLCLSLNVTEPAESVNHVRTAHQVVSQMLHAKIHAKLDQLRIFTLAAGTLQSQNASKMTKVQ